MSMLADHVRAAAAARLLGITRQAVCHLVQKGRLRSVRQGHQVWIPLADIHARIAAKAILASPAPGEVVATLVAKAA